MVLVWYAYRTTLLRMNTLDGEIRPVSDRCGTGRLLSRNGFHFPFLTRLILLRAMAGGEPLALVRSQISDKNVYFPIDGRSAESARRPFRLIKER